MSDNFIRQKFRSGDFQDNGPNKTIFGDTIIASYTPIVQNYTPYGIINNQLYDKFEENKGTVTANDNGIEINCNITTDVSSTALLRSKRVVKYRPGYSNIIRATARFAPGVADSLQYVGVGNSGSGLYFAMDGTEFGILRSTGGISEIWRLRVTASATGIENAGIVIDDVGYLVALTNAGGNLIFTAHQIYASFKNAGLTEWRVEQNDVDVYFIAVHDGEKKGAFTFVSTSATATFTRIKTGVAITDYFVRKDEWNGGSRMVTDVIPTNNNLYEIEYSWFGSSNIYFRIYNTNSGKFENVHTLNFSNLGTTLSLSRPNMYIEQGLQSFGSTTAMQFIGTCSIATTLGNFSISVPSYSVDVVKTIDAKTETNIVVLKNRDFVNGFINNSQIYIARITCAIDGVHPVVIQFIKNPVTISASTTTDYANFEYIDVSNSLLLYDDTSKTYTGGTIIDRFYVGKNGSLTIEFDKNLVLYQNEYLVMTAYSDTTNVVSLSVSTIDDL